MRQNDEIPAMNNRDSWSTENEAELIINAKEGSSFALNELSQRYALFLRSLAKRLTFNQLETEELVQAGYIGLFTAVNKYDSSKQTKLITYAVPWILGEMKAVIRERYAALKWMSLDAATFCEECTLRERLIGTSEINIDVINLRMAMSELTSDEQWVISLRYYRDKTQKETSVLLGKCQAQISRLERAALDKLKDRLL